jgi:hypothetical protein
MVKAMTDVQFEEPDYQQQGPPRPKKTSFLAGIFISLGLAKDEAGAQRPMLIATIIVALLAVAIFFLFG